MTENEKKLNRLIDTLIDLVSTIEYSDIVSHERFLEFDTAGAEIIGCIEDLKEYRAIGTIEEFKALKENQFFNFDSPVVRVDKKSYDKAIDEFAEKLNTDVESFVAEVDGVRADLLTLDYFSEFVFEVAEKLKGGAE